MSASANVRVNIGSTSFGAMTVFAARMHQFPPATFFAVSDAIQYAMSFSPTYGACTCPALSFEKHHGSRHD